MELAIWRPDCIRSFSNLLIIIENIEETEQEKIAREKFLAHLERVKRTSISIQRIPEQYKTRFMEIAKTEFANDYGLCLRELIRTWDGVYIDTNEEVNTKINILAEEINKINQHLNQKKLEIQLRKTASGRAIIKG